jgi:hypothetical protein
MIKFILTMLFNCIILSVVFNLINGTEKTK